MDWVEIINLVAAFVVSGLVTTVIVQALKNAAWANRTKMALSLVISALVGAAQVWIAGDVLGLIDTWQTATAQDVILVMTLAFAGATAYYKTWFQGKPWMQGLERWIWGAGE